MLEKLKKLVSYNVINEVVLYDRTINKISTFDVLFIFDVIKDDVNVLECKLVDGILFVVIEFKEV